MFLFSILLIVLGIVYRKYPNIYRRGIWLKTSITIRMMTPETYESYMRKLGAVFIALGSLFVAIRVLAVLASNSTPAVTPPANSPSAHQVKLPTPESGNYQQLCTEEWTKRGVLDSEMFDSCMRDQAEGDRKLDDFVTKYSSLPWMQAVVDAAAKKWIKRGMRNEEMVAYQVGQQIDAYLDIKYASGQKGYKPDALAQCEAKWWSSDSPDWEMTWFCYKEATGTN